MKRYLVYRKSENPGITGRFFSSWAIDITGLAETSVGDLISELKRDASNDRFAFHEGDAPKVDELIES